MEDQIASFKDKVHEKLIGYFRPSQEGNQQKPSLEDETRLILFIYLCFNCLMFTMVSLKIFIYWVAVNVLVFVFLKYFLVEQRPEMTFDTQFGRQVRTQTFFEGGYTQEVKVNEVKPKVKAQPSEKNDKESYVLKESKSTVKKRSIYAMDLPAESNHLQAQSKEQSFRQSANEPYEKVPREQPSFSTEHGPVDDKKNTEPKTSWLLKIRGSISNLKFRIARKNIQGVDSNKKSFLSLFSFARLAKRKEEKESIQADDAPMEIEEEEIQEIPKNKGETTEIPKEKEEPKVQQETQEEIVNKRNKISQDFQNQVIQELMKQMGGKNLSQLIAPKQQQHNINQILNEMESELSDKKGQDMRNSMSMNKSQTTTTAPVSGKDQTKLVKEPVKIPQTFANSQRTNKEESKENINKNLNQPSLKMVPEEQNTQKPIIQSQSTNKPIIEEPKSTRTKARLAYIDDDSEEENQHVTLTKENQNLNETQTETKIYQASFTLNEQNANNESLPEQPQDSEYENVSFGKSRYFACVFADRPLREVEDEAKPENETDVRPENEISYGNNFGIQFPGNEGNQDWGQNIGGLNQASFFNNFGEYFKTDSWNNNEPQYEENQNTEYQNQTLEQNTNQEIRENPEENHRPETSYQNITQNFNDNNEAEEENHSLLLVKQNTNKQVNTSFSGGGLANNQKKGFLGRRGLASGSSFGLSGKNTK